MKHGEPRPGKSIILAGTALIAAVCYKPVPQSTSPRQVPTVDALRQCRAIDINIDTRPKEID